MADGDNKMVWVEETALYCSVRMRKGCRGESRVQTQEKTLV